MNKVSNLFQLPAMLDLSIERNNKVVENLLDASVTEQVWFFSINFCCKKFELTGIPLSQGNYMLQQVVKSPTKPQLSQTASSFQANTIETPRSTWIGNDFITPRFYRKVIFISYDKLHLVFVFSPTVCNKII